MFSPRVVNRRIQKQMCAYVKMTCSSQLSRRRVYFRDLLMSITQISRNFTFSHSFFKGVPPLSQVLTGFFLRRRKQGTQAYQRGTAAGADGANQSFLHPLVHGPLALADHLACLANSYQDDRALALRAARRVSGGLYRSRQRGRFIGLMTPTAIVPHGGPSERLIAFFLLEA